MQQVLDGKFFKYTSLPEYKRTRLLVLKDEGLVALSDFIDDD